MGSRKLATPATAAAVSFFLNGKPLTDFGPDQLLAIVKTELDQAK